MENFESEQFKEEPAEEIEETPKEEHEEVSKENKEFKDEEEVDDGLGVLLRKKNLYHGSGTSGIETFNNAEEDTVGSGTYFTSKVEDAIGYARRRSRDREGASPVVYESLLDDMKLLDLRKDENVSKVLEGFKKILEEKLREPDLKWNYEAVLQRAVEAIDAGEVGANNLREVTFSTGQMFSEYVKSLGYEGLVTFEGGEGDDIGNHDTYLIFDPEKAKISQEHNIL